jgi:CheY-like chemotaxis protein
MPTALIVEDEPEANKLLSMLVQLRGYGTVSAYNGGEALTRVDLQPPDIVFLDLMLPDISGYEVCKALKSRKSTALIPVVMVTARVALENRLESFCVGADQYIPKPYTPDQIFEAMDDADHWRRQVDTAGGEFELAFGANDDGETLRRLAQLRSLMFANTPLNAERTCAVNEALREIWQDANAWAVHAGVSCPASLSYKTESEGVLLTLRDLSGWFSDDPIPPVVRWPEAIAHGRFDEVRPGEHGASVTFVVRFPEATPPERDQD